MKRSFKLAVAAVVVAVIMTGCGGGEDSGTSEASTPVQKDSGGKTQADTGKRLEELDISKYVTLGNYKGLSVSINETTVTDEDLKEAEQSSLEMLKAQEVVTGRPVKEGDTVNIDYEGKIDGVAFQGGTAKGYDLVIGSGNFINGFEEGLIGAKTGETRNLNLKFPEDYHIVDKAGKDVVFTVKVNSIKEDIIPTLTDDVAKQLDSDVSTAEEYREKLKETLQMNKNMSARAQAYNDLFAQVQDNSNIAVGDAIPEWLIEENKASEKENFESSLASYGLDLNSYLTQQGMTEADFDKTLEAYAQSIARQQLLVYALAKAENIKVTDADVEAQYEEDAPTYGYDSGDELKAAVKSQGAEKNFRDAVLMRKVQEMLFENAKVSNPDKKSW